MTAGLATVRSTFQVLTDHHYLGPTKAAAFAWSSTCGVLVFAAPRGRNLPPEWLELVRWCIIGGKNAGSAGWAEFSAWAKSQHRATTVVSYSDPSQGHTGALYRASNWLWAPTWHRLRPPPSGNGQWTAGKQQAVKDRWVYPLRPDPGRALRLQVMDDAIMRRMPWAQYREPRWSGRRFDPSTGGGDYKRFMESRP